MGLTATQRALLVKARTASATQLGVSLDDGVCAYLAAVLISDLQLQEHFPGLPSDLPPFFGTDSLGSLRLEGVAFLQIYDRLVTLIEDADAYFYCLATLHKARLKYERILQAQALPTVDQVGARGLLQYGSLTPKSLIGFLFWWKWLFDIDNRAGQETGYLFEPIVAYAIGGVPYSAQKSPIKRGGVGPTGRQVDCIRERQAYEIKMRVTIAASGQGRWREELEFPNDCKSSSYTPVLVVFDPTPSRKLTELSNAFRAASGEVYIGRQAWEHLESLAGPTMAKFLHEYIQLPIQSLLEAAHNDLPEMTLRMDKKQLTILLDDETLQVQRDVSEAVTSGVDEFPDDIDETIPGL